MSEQIQTETQIVNRLAKRQHYNIAKTTDGKVDVIQERTGYVIATCRNIQLAILVMNALEEQDEID